MVGGSGNTILIPPIKTVSTPAIQKSVTTIGQFDPDPGIADANPEVWGFRQIS